MRENRLIDLNALGIGKCNPNVFENRAYADGWNAAIKVIETTPTVDAVEVVRCKDCKYWQDNNGGYPNEDCRWGHEETPDADDYCSFGERRAESE